MRSSTSSSKSVGYFRFSGKRSTAPITSGKCGSASSSSSSPSSSSSSSPTASSYEVPPSVADAAHGSASSSSSSGDTVSWIARMVRSGRSADSSPRTPPSSSQAAPTTMTGSPKASLAKKASTSWVGYAFTASSTSRGPARVNATGCSPGAAPGRSTRSIRSSSGSGTMKVSGFSRVKGPRGTGASSAASSSPSSGSPATASSSGSSGGGLVIPELTSPPSAPQADGGCTGGSHAATTPWMAPHSAASV